MSSATRGLEVRSVRKDYPGTVALESVDLEIAPGELVALLGENGAGKSTLSSIIAGATQPTSGEMTWNGELYAPSSPRDAIAEGIGLIHQEMRLLPDLSVAENIVVGRWPLRGGMLDTAAMRSQAKEQLDRLGFKGSLDQPLEKLSVAAQQQVEIAKALMLDASLLILDEPTASLGAEETDALFETIHELKDQGMSFIYVSHRLSEIKRIADRIVVLRDGAQVATHGSGDVEPEQLVSEMVGRSVERLFPELPKAQDDVVLQVEGLTSHDSAFSDITFDVHAGEIFGVAGIVGAGRTEIIRAIAAADTKFDGSVQVNGKLVRKRGPADAVKAGIVLIPEDRKNQGLIVDQTIEDNIALPNMSALKRWGWILPRHVRELAQSVSRRHGVKGRPQDAASSMSGGNQQKAVIGKWLELNPQVIILDEPTRGIDVGARASIYEAIAELAASGVAVVLVSSDLEEVLGLAHRVMVVSEGEARDILPGDRITREEVMSLAVTS